MGISYFVTNGLLVGLLLELGHMMFRVVAFWMVILLFVMYAALATFILYLCCAVLWRANRVTRSLRLFAPCLWSVCSVLGCITPIRPLSAIKPYSSIRRWISHCVSGVTICPGILFGARQLDKLTDIMKQEQVDMVLLPGDLMDDTVDAYLKENMKPHLQKLTAPMGVYATLGNHDWFPDRSASNMNWKRQV